MDTVTTLSIVKRLMLASNTEDLCAVFAHNVADAIGYGHALVSQRSIPGSELLPVACNTGKPPEWPIINTDEVNNPLVYTLISKKKCFVDNISRLVDIGPAFDQLRRLCSFNDALVALPILGSKNRALGIVAVLGPKHHIEAWVKSNEWQELTAIFSQIFSALNNSITQRNSTRAEREFLQEQLEKKTHEQARRFIATEYVGSSPNAKRIRSEILGLATSSLAVLVTGETGVGKDHVASLIHKTSDRSEGPFVPVNCAAISKDLIDSELFGSVKGAFTGAQMRAGLVAAANGGTLFLDEIGDMPLPLQVALLRLLNEKKYRPVGSNQEEVSDFRLICATNRPLQQMVREGLFREDLYFRIRQASLELPPLRQRSTDVGPLCWYLIQKYNHDHQRYIAGIDISAIDLFRLYSFPGNIRELKYLMLSMCEKTSTGNMITKETAGAEFAKLKDSPAHQMPSPAAVELPSTQDLEALLRTNNLPQALEHFEQTLIRMRLMMSNGSRKQAAESLGIPKRTLARKCQQWSLGVNKK